MSKREDIFDTVDALLYRGKHGDAIADMDETQLERARKDRDEFQATVDAFKKFGDTMNRMSRDDFLGPAFIEAMCRTHRTLQEKVIFDLLRGLGNYGKMFDEEPLMMADARNEFAMKLCKKVYDVLKDDLFWKDKA